MTIEELPEDFTGVVYCGKMGSGKTTTAQETARLLWDQYETEARIFPFAEPLKAATAAVLDNHPADEVGELAKSEIRPCYQAIGTKLREYWPDVWVETTKNRILALPDGVVALNDDCRYPNEVETMKEIGMVVVRLLASEELRGSRIELSGTGHQSETALDDYPIANYDLVIDQDSGSWAAPSTAGLSGSVNKNPTPTEIANVVIENLGHFYPATETVIVGSDDVVDGEPR